MLLHNSFEVRSKLTGDKCKSVALLTMSMTAINCMLSKAGASKLRVLEGPKGIAAVVVSHALESKEGDHHDLASIISAIK